MVNEDKKWDRISVEIMDSHTLLAGRERGGPSRALVTSPNMSAQHIGQHSPALRTKPQDQQGQSCFLIAPNSNLLSLNEGDFFLWNVEQFAGIHSKGSITSSHLILSGFKPFICSTMTVSVYSRLGFIRCPSVLLLTLTGLSLSSPIRSPENRHRASVGRGDNPLLDAQDFLSLFRATMNLTELRPQPRPLAAREEPPDYMLELYNRFAHDHTAVPSANIVRSFKNEGTNLFLFITDQFSWKMYILH